MQNVIYDSTTFFHRFRHAQVAPSGVTHLTDQHKTRLSNELRYVHFALCM